jgi:hypothetical protein
VTLPRDPLLGLESGEQRTAPDQRHGRADGDLHQSAVEGAPGDQVGRVTEHDAARTKMDRPLGRDQPGAQAAHKRGDHGHPDQAQRSVEGDHHAHHHEGQRVGDQMAEADVEKRRGDHAVQAVRVARLDAVAVEAVVERQVDDLEHPHQRDEREQDPKSAPARAGGG